MHRLLQLIDLEPHRFHWTRDQYDRLADLDVFQERRVQLIEGEIIEMSPQRRPHAMTIQLVCSALAKAFGDGYSIFSQLPIDLTLDSKPEPDVAVVRGAARDYPNHPSSALLIVEVSDTTLGFDTTRKAALYARAGIEDYWIINLIASRIDVYRRPVIDSQFEYGAGYEDVRSFGSNETVSPLAARNAFVHVHDLLP